ncbi:hypothetical protein [Fluviispira multicolorata]|uniref:Uncharacterized protein n=1 Tax=Fluviispira multicolorata TaxID=2654512 RepID=A0A833JD27_9BACT|nr:hypothetical protein [Fluviispira multicolorata]KAB8030690.1 hypothetical protein GCL57_06865 [Fluviispira multicolorata]
MSMSYKKECIFSDIILDKGILFKNLSDDQILYYYSFLKYEIEFYNKYDFKCNLISDIDCLRELRRTKKAKRKLEKILASRACSQIFS